MSELQQLVQNVKTGISPSLRDHVKALVDGVVSGDNDSFAITVSYEECERTERMIEHYLCDHEGLECRLGVQFKMDGSRKCTIYVAEVALPRSDRREINWGGPQADLYDRSMGTRRMERRPAH